MNEQDIITTRNEAKEAHETAKFVLTKDSAPDAEQQRDLCEEKKNGVISVINFCEDQLEALRKEKRKLDDKMADVRSLQREFDGLKADLTTDFKRLNNHFWDIKKGRNEPKNEQNAEMRNFGGRSQSNQ